VFIVAKLKFGVDLVDEVSVVLEEDGTCVDEEEYFQHGLQDNSVLMLLKSHESWTGIWYCALKTFTHSIKFYLI